MLCTFCKAEQPRISQTPAAKEKRCARCNRPFAAKLAECPFCARERAGSVPPRSPSAIPPPAEAGEPPSTAALANVALFFGPLLVAAAWGTSRVLWSPRLGQEHPTLFVVLAALLGLGGAIGIGIGYARRVFGPLGDAIDDEGMGRVAASVGVTAAFALVPSALVVYGLASWVNTFGNAAHEQDIACTAGQNHGAPDGTWQMAFTCAVEGGAVRGVLHGTGTKPALEEQAPFRFRAVRGPLGVWLRLSEPMPPKPEL